MDAGVRARLPHSNGTQKGTSMLRTHLTLAALLALAVALPHAQTDLSLVTAADELAADVESAAHYAIASSTGASFVYDDPEVVSLTCAGAADPLDCTAQEGASVLEQDAASDALLVDLVTPLPDTTLADTTLAPDLTSASSGGNELTSSALAATIDSSATVMA